MEDFDYLLPYGVPKYDLLKSGIYSMGDGASGGGTNPPSFYSSDITSNILPYVGGPPDYIKYRKSFVVGYYRHGVQVIRGADVYTGYRSLISSIHGETPYIEVYLGGYLKPYFRSSHDINVYVNPYKRDETLLEGHIRSFDLRDFVGFIRQVYQSDTSVQSDLRAVYSGDLDLNSYFGGHRPKDLNVIFRGIEPEDLPSYIGGHRIKRLFGYVDMHRPRHLRSRIATHKPKDLIAYVASYLESLLGSTITSHLYQHLQASVKIYSTTELDLRSSITIYLEKYLTASLGIVKDFDLTSQIKSHLYEDLKVRIRLIQIENLRSFIRGYGSKLLTSDLRAIQTDVLRSYIGGDLSKDLRGIVKTIGSTTIDLVSGTYSWDTSYLSGLIRLVHIQNLTSYLYAIPPRDLPSCIQIFHDSFLNSSLEGLDYSFQLRGIIKPVGDLYNIRASIYPKTDTNVEVKLNSSLYSYDFKELNSNISSNLDGILTAEIYPLNTISHLKASIFPNKFLLSSAITINLMQSHQLRAMINVGCFMTGFKHITANIRSTYLYDLTSYVRCISLLQESDLTASYGFHSKKSIVQKQQLLLKYQHTSKFIRTKSLLNLYIFNSQVGLRATIQPTMRSRVLRSTIIPVTVKPYVFRTKTHSVKYANTTRSGLLENYKDIEIRFKEAVSEYNYTQDYGIWKKDSLEKWILSIKSYVPEYERGVLKRKIHKAFSLQDLKSFPSMDSALKYAITYVTELPTKDLKAILENNSLSIKLTGNITPLYVKHSLSNLTSEIIALDKQPHILYDKKTEDVVLESCYVISKSLDVIVPDKENTFKHSVQVISKSLDVIVPDTKISLEHSVQVISKSLDVIVPDNT